ncbi:MAG: zinc ribbon domain-containing protein [Betaproteobacteria bacterium]|nr:zinc ribbon domain-containing protein [Betaproteobacteria bacterium]
MPIYEYRCEACGHQEEHLQKASEAPLAACPSCGKAAYKKLLSAAGFQLKGSGWYATDFKSGGKKPAEKPGEAKTESTPDTKTGGSTESAACGAGACPACVAN